LVSRKIVERPQPNMSTGIRWFCQTPIAFAAAS
jgi:hypothetical protein